MAKKKTIFIASVVVASCALLTSGTTFIDSKIHEAQQAKCLEDQQNIEHLAYQKFKKRFEETEKAKDKAQKIFIADFNKDLEDRQANRQKQIISLNESISMNIKLERWDAMYSDVQRMSEVYRSFVIPEFNERLANEVLQVSRFEQLEKERASWIDSSISNKCKVIGAL